MKIQKLLIIRIQIMLIINQIEYLFLNMFIYLKTNQLFNEIENKNSLLILLQKSNI